MSSKFLTYCFLLILSAISVFAFAYDDEGIELDEDGNPIVQPDMAPEWQLRGEANLIVSSKDLAGKPYVLSFCASWSPYCKKFQPGLDYISIDYVTKGIPTYAVSFWENSNAKPLKEFEKLGLMLPMLVDGDAVAKEFAVLALPTTIFVNQEGEILYRHLESDPNDPQLRVAYEELKDAWKNPKPKNPEGEEDGD
jgi:cytochrome c biogenesis protein CcmG, thiol:disulfide interchange protein DsbE